MGNQAVRIVLIPRYTSFVGLASGTLDYYTPPINVRGFGAVEVVVWRGASPTGTPTFKLQESTDGVTWTDKGTLDSTADDEDVTTLDPLDTEWVRVKVSAPANGRFSCWIIAQFIIREA